VCEGAACEQPTRIRFTDRHAELCCGKMLCLEIHPGPVFKFLVIENHSQNIWVCGQGCEVKPERKVLPSEGRACDHEFAPYATIRQNSGGRN